MIDFTTLQGLTIPEGVVTQITDESGRVIWSAMKEIVTGTLYLRPSADISVEHFLWPATSDIPAYQRINEEVSDGNALYIGSNQLQHIDYPVSKFKLSNTTQFSEKLLAVTNVSINVVPMNDGNNDFKLEVNGIETEWFVTNETKEFSLSVPTAIDLINEYITAHGVLPDINIIIRSNINKENTKTNNSGVTQVYVVLTYEGY